MRYCSPGDPFTFLDSPEFYSTTLHTLGCLYLPVYLLGALIIINKTPDDMKSVKWALVNFHFWNCVVDITLSLLTTPYMLCPLIAGYPMGILAFFGMDTMQQYYLVNVTQAAMGVSMLCLFENRYFIISSENGFWAKVRVPWTILNYVIAFTYILPAYTILKEEEVPNTYLQELLPCLPDRILKAPLFIVASVHPVANYNGPIYILFILLQGIILYFMITVSLKRYGNQHSEKTMRLQQKFIRSLKLQIAMPFLIFAVPIFYNTIASAVSYRNQFFYNVSYMMLSSHGFCSTIAILLIHEPYKRAVMRAIGVGDSSLNSISSKQASIVTVL